MKSNIAITSVNKITSKIRSTLQKGNSLIRSQSAQLDSADRHLKTQNFNKTFLIGQEQIKAVSIYEKVKPYTINNEKTKQNIINILNFAQIKWDEFCAIQNKSGHHYNQFLQKFKKIDSKLKTYLNLLIVEDNVQKINSIKIQFKRIIQYLNQRARKYIDKNKQIINLIKKKDHQTFQQECQQEAIKEEMLQLLDRLKGQAINMGSDLKKDNVVISQIHQKQDKQLDVLSSKSKNLQEMMNSQKMGFFKLISYAGIGIAVWIFTLLFILIF